MDGSSRPMQEAIDPLSQRIHLLRVDSDRLAQQDVRSSKGNKRGRKPDLAARAERDLLRKTNHSLIEKRRRTKINEALATLRELVPNEMSDEEASEGEGGKKEFKLEVLVRTVAYLKKLIDKVNQLEETLAQVSASKGPVEYSPEQSPLNKRSRALAIDDDGSTISRPPSTIQSTHCCSSSPQPSTPQFRLPPISSLFRPETQLPSPPSSTQHHPTMHLSAPPAITLPLPYSYDTPWKSRSEGGNSTPSGEGSSSKHRRRRSSWTREDEAVASMLLEISSTSSSVPIRATLPPLPSQSSPFQSQVHTPAFLLGIRPSADQRTKNPP